MGEHVGGHCPIVWGNFSYDDKIYKYNPAQTTMTGGDKSNNWKEKHNNQPDNDADDEDDDGKNKDKDEDEDKDE